MIRDSFSPSEYKTFVQVAHLLMKEPQRITEISAGQLSKMMSIFLTLERKASLLDLPPGQDLDIEVRSSYSSIHSDVKLHWNNKYHVHTADLETALRLALREYQFPLRPIHTYFR
jgi:hypothetical protein